MSFHKKALIGFLIFHAIFTVGGMIAGLSQNAPTPTNDRDMVAKGVWPYVWVLLGAALSLVGLALAYLTRAAVRLINRLLKKSTN
jgi:lysylphosphatidylglycerol synthetase-like protein (DUF2156 family)